jgi:hypothetical protein
MAANQLRWRLDPDKSLPDAQPCFFCDSRALCQALAVDTAALRAHGVRGLTSPSHNFPACGECAARAASDGDYVWRSVTDHFLDQLADRLTSRQLDRYLKWAETTCEASRARRRDRRRANDFEDEATYRRRKTAGARLPEMLDNLLCHGFGGRQAIGVAADWCAEYAAGYPYADELREAYQQEEQMLNPPFEVGTSYLICTATLYYVGRVIEKGVGWIRLDNASWVHWTGRLSTLLSNCTFTSAEFRERRPRVEPSKCVVGIGTQTIVSWYEAPEGKTWELPDEPVGE